jgi:hypothetical protein
MDATRGPSSPPVSCEASGLAGSVKYTSIHEACAPYPAGSGISVSQDSGVSVSTGRSGVGGNWEHPITFTINVIVTNPSNRFNRFMRLSWRGIILRSSAVLENPNTINTMI